MKLTDKYGASATCSRHRTGSGLASNYRLRGGGRRLIAWAPAQPLASLIDSYHPSGDVRPPKNTTQRLLLPSLPGLVSLCYRNATHRHSPLRDKEDTVALRNWNVVHKQSRPALLSHQNTERDVTAQQHALNLAVTCWLHYECSGKTGHCNTDLSYLTPSFIVASFHFHS